MAAVELKNLSSSVHCWVCSGEEKVVQPGEGGKVNEKY